MLSVLLAVKYDNEGMDGNSKKVKDAKVKDEVKDDGVTA